MDATEQAHRTAHINQLAQRVRYAEEGTAQRHQTFLATAARVADDPNNVHRCEELTAALASLARAERVLLNRRGELAEAMGVEL
jgi:hypothetical protein